MAVKLVFKTKYLWISIFPPDLQAEARLCLVRSLVAQELWSLTTDGLTWGLLTQPGRSTLSMHGGPACYFQQLVDQYEIQSMNSKISFSLLVWF